VILLFLIFALSGETPLTFNILIAVCVRLKNCCCKAPRVSSPSVQRCWWGKKQGMRGLNNFFPFKTNSRLYLQPAQTFLSLKQNLYRSVCPSTVSSCYLPEYIAYSSRIYAEDWFVDDKGQDPATVKIISVGSSEDFSCMRPQITCISNIFIQHSAAARTRSWSCLSFIFFCKLWR